MTGRSLRKTCFVVALLLIAMGSITACNLFGRQSATAPTGTPPPPPTETPLPALPTLTPTPTALVLPTSTPTKVIQEAEAKPTITPTIEPTATAVKSETKASEPQAVAYGAKKVPVMGDVIVNGSFEGGFQANGVGEGWAAFDNGGVGKRTYLEELAPVHISHGDHGQLLQLTGAGTVDLYIGIYQTVDVVAGETYTLSIHGLIRTSDADDPDVHYGHRTQWAIDYGGKGDWQAVEEWFDTGWNDIPLDQTGPVMNYVSLPIEAKTDKLTLFIRGWTKWPMQAIAKFYIDGVFLQGPVPGEGKVTQVAVDAGTGSSEEGMPTTGGSAIWLPIAGTIFVIGFALWEIRKTRRPAA